MNGRETNVVEIVSHLEYWGKSNNVSLIRPDDHFKVDELARKGISLFKLDNDDKYCWVAIQVIWTPSTLNIVTTITNVDIMVENSSDWSVHPVDRVERIYNSLKGCSVPLYECLFTKLGVHFPFFLFSRYL